MEEKSKTGVRWLAQVAWEPVWQTDNFLEWEHETQSRMLYID